MTTLTNTVRIPVEPAVPGGYRLDRMFHGLHLEAMFFNERTQSTIRRTCPYPPGSRILVAEIAEYPRGSRYTREFYTTVLSVRPELDDVWKWVVEVE